ncbi:MAG: hypothetical protein D6762_01685 [Candidatus Neomarinimicrobiota bacterium]|nr:MAG: hypothetical protein D6762_01685 [Candidatus Neomarinimicrobiota bacterium]
MKVLPLLVLCLESLVLAVPRYALLNGTSCSHCHVDPAGGGIRTEHGIDIVSQLELPWTPKATTYTGALGQHLRMGGDLRFLTYSYPDTGRLSRQTLMFPMQMDAYLIWDSRDGLTASLEQDLGSRQGRFWIRQAWGRYSLRAGIFQPDFGWKLPDHTAFIRAGNSRPRFGLPREGLPFQQRVYPAGVEGAWQSGRTRLVLALTNGFLTGKNLQNGRSETWNQKARSLKIERVLGRGPLRGLAAVSLVKEGKASLAGIQGGWNWGWWTWLGEADRMLNVEPGVPSLATYSRLLLSPHQGLEGSLTWEFFDHDIRYANNALNRLSVGINWTPVPFLEIVLENRWFRTEAGTQRPETLLLIHSWF